MNRKRLINNGGHFVLLQMLWPAAVVGAAHGMTWPSVAVLAGMFIWSAWRGLGLRPDLRLAIGGLVIGIVFELLLIGGGLIHYALQQGPGWPPFWILVLWAGFSLNLRHCLGWFREHPVAGSLFGLIGAPFSVIAGVALGAATAPSGQVELALAYGLGWALAMPLLSLLAFRLEVEERQTGECDDPSVVV